MKTLLTRVRRPADDNDEIVTAFRDGQVTLRSNRRSDGFTMAEKEIGYQGVLQGDLVVHSMDGFAGAIGVSDSNGKVSPVVHCYVSTSRADARFVAYLLRSLAHSGYISALAKGIRERSTSFDPQTLMELSVVVPEVTEQARIADYLDEQMADISQLLEKQSQLSVLLRSRARHYLQLSFRASGAIEETGLPWIPVGFGQVIPLKYLVTCLDFARVPLNATERAKRVGSVPYYGASSVVDHVDDYLFDEELVLVGEDGAALENLDSDVVQVIHGKSWVNNHAHVLRTSHHIRPRYLAEYLRNVDRVTLITGATRPKITQDALMQVPVVLPEIEVQDLILNEFDEVSRDDIKVLRAVNELQQLLVERRHGLVAAAVTGQLDVMLREVVPDSADGWAADGGVEPMVIVEVHPVGQGVASFCF